LPTDIAADGVIVVLTVVIMAVIIIVKYGLLRLAGTE
jgi:hypothetical protein